MLLRHNFALLPYSLVALRKASRYGVLPSVRTSRFNASHFLGMLASDTAVVDIYFGRIPQEPSNSVTKIMVFLRVTAWSCIEHAIE